MKFGMNEAVVIKDEGMIHPKAIELLAEYSHELSDTVLAGFQYGKMPDSDSLEHIFKVKVGILVNELSFVYVIHDGKDTYLIREEGLESAETVSPGKRVVVIDKGAIYSTYTEFMLLHRPELRDSDPEEVFSATLDRIFWNYRYGKGFGDKYEEGKDYGFRVALIAEHTDAMFRGRKLAVIYNDEDTFIINVKALKVI